MDFKDWTRNDVFTAVAALAALVSIVGAVTSWLAVSSDELDFSGVTVRAEIHDSARPRLILPATFDREPVSVVIKGSLRDTENPSERPLSFELPLALHGIERNEHGTVLVYEDLRPVLCEEMGGPTSCGGFEISRLALLATFARGPKTANIYDIPQIQLN